MTSNVNELLLDIKSNWAVDISPNSLVFPNDNGRQQIQVSKSFYKIIDELGFNNSVSDSREKVCFHTLRHTLCKLANDERDFNLRFKGSSWAQNFGDDASLLTFISRHKEKSRRFFRREI